LGLNPTFADEIFIIMDVTKSQVSETPPQIYRLPADHIQKQRDERSSMEHPSRIPLIF
ncbi:hypothetical protein K7432_011644, partial [Basidiobolus ranarum]